MRGPCFVRLEWQALKCTRQRQGLARRASNSIDAIHGSSIGHLVPISGLDPWQGELCDHFAFAPAPLPTDLAGLRPSDHTSRLVVRAATALTKLDQSRPPSPKPGSTARTDASTRGAEQIRARRHVRRVHCRARDASARWEWIDALPPGQCTANSVFAAHGPLFTERWSAGAGTRTLGCRGACSLTASAPPSSAATSMTLQIYSARLRSSAARFCSSRIGVAIRS